MLHQHFNNSNNKKKVANAFSELAIIWTKCYCKSTRVLKMKIIHSLSLSSENAFANHQHPTTTTTITT